MKKTSVYWVICAVFALSSCLQKELPVDPIPKGNLTTGQVEMGSTYGQQVWFDLDENKVVQIEDKYAYSFVFSGSDLCPRLNTAIGISVALVSEGHLGEEVEYSALTYTTDISTLEQDSLALRQVVEGNKLYAVNLGFDPLGRPLGYAQMLLERKTNLHWKLKVYLPSEETEQEYEIHLADASDQIGFDITNGERVVLPALTDYDVLFTTYTNVFYEPEFMFYQVSGVLINPHRTLAYQTSDVDFTTYSISDVQVDLFSDWADVIGYDWKYYDYNSGIYVVDPSQIYTLQSRLGYWYKLRFVDFYNNAGVKGYPTFEFQRL